MSKYLLKFENEGLVPLLLNVLFFNIDVRYLHFIINNYDSDISKYL